ncbi:MAG: hypothetical protein JST58_09130 [Bacteroidetes bacterium]|nr:hypothetical protein [Bacteroidota bacterium]
MEQKNEIQENHSGIKCRVCGAFLYKTDHGNHEATFHCSSGEARFWDFERGTRDQTKAKEHWDNSRMEIFLDVDGALQFVLNNE